MCNKTKKSCLICIACAIMVIELISMADLTPLASQPKKVITDNGTLENHSLYEQIALDKFNTNKKLVNGFKRGRAVGVPNSPRG